MPGRVYTYDREGRRNPPPRKGPSNRTRRIITVTIAILLLVLIIVLIAHGCSKHNKRHDDYIETTQPSQSQSVPQESSSGKVIQQNMFQDLRADYNLPYCITVNTAQNVVTVYTRSTPNGPTTRRSRHSSAPPA